jgi:hypothetical protein
MIGEGVALGDIDLPNLRELVLHGSLPEDAQWSLARMAAPNLASLDLETPLAAEPAAQLAERFPKL